MPGKHCKLFSAIDVLASSLPRTLSCVSFGLHYSANPAARVGYYTRTLSTSTQNASIWSLTAAAPSDKCFTCAVYKVACYLLTYSRLSDIGCFRSISGVFSGLVTVTEL